MALWTGCLLGISLYRRKGNSYYSCLKISTVLSFTVHLNIVQSVVTSFRDLELWRLKWCFPGSSKGFIFFFQMLSASLLPALEQINHISFFSADA